MVDSFEVYLAPLDPAVLGDIFHSTSRPCIATDPRARFLTAHGYSGTPRISDESRAKGLKRAVAQGALAIDFELDMFRTGTSATIRPGGERGLQRGRLEMSMEPEVVAMQSELATAIRGVGAEVVMSCSTQSVLRKTDAVKIVREVRKRGGQFARIDSLTPRRQDIFKTLGCVFSLSRDSRIPFTMMNIGVGSGSDRLISLLAGSSWVYCQPSNEQSYAGLPTVDDAVSFIDSLGLRNP